MFSFNRKEQLALLLLSGALLVGIVISLIAEWRQGGLPDFRVVKGAVPVPSDTARVDSVLAATDTAPRPVNINTASAQDLQVLPRIGPSTARRIVDYRTQHGPFLKADDLAKVSGIGPKTVARLKPLITLDSP